MENIEYKIIKSMTDERLKEIKELTERILKEREAKHYGKSALHMDV